MRAIAPGLFAATFLLSCGGMAWMGAACSVKADDAIPKADESPALGDVDLTYHQLERQVAHTSIIWVDETTPRLRNDRSIAGLANDFVKMVNDERRDDKAELRGSEPMMPAPSAIYEDLGAFVIDMPPAETARALAEMRHSEIERRVEESNRIAPSLSTSADMIVSIMDEINCSDEDAKTFAEAGITPKTTPIGVQRVGGGGNAASYTKKVWIIDTGIDNASKLINVDATDAAYCTAKSAAACQVPSAADFERRLMDKIGHGTMLAGIIAATPGNETDPSLVGVAPGVTVVPIRIFGSTPDVNLSGPPLKALNYVAAHATAGDIVNISWGAAWLEGMDRKKNLIETVLGSKTANNGLVGKLQKMATQLHLKLVVAAGNVDPVTRPSWVQLVMPAGAGSFPAANAGCDICTVSAVESKQDNAGNWTDTFWFDLPTTATGSPQFGSDYGRNPPDFAEPGVKVTSLWPSDKGTANLVNTCSGTSFAAAHLSGMLVRGTPKPVFNVLGDPDSPTDKTTADPVGVLP